MKRPVSLSILGWFIVVTNAIALLAWPWTLRNPESQAAVMRAMMPVQIVYAVALEALCLIAGIGILKGRAGARTLYVVATLVSFAITLVMSRWTLLMLPGAVLAALFFYLLYRPAATAYFRRDAQ